MLAWAENHKVVLSITTDYRGFKHVWILIYNTVQVNEFFKNILVKCDYFYLFSTGDCFYFQSRGNVSVSGDVFDCPK